MINAGVLKFSNSGRVVVSLTDTVVNFNGGTPVLNDGTLCGSINDPNLYLAGFGYTTSKLCARDSLPDNLEGGLGRTSVGGLALAIDDPIAYYFCGLPMVADGRLAVELASTPPSDIRAFSNGFDQGFA